MLAVMVFAVNAYAAQSDEIRSTLGDQKEVSVTIYNDGTGLVRDVRTVRLDEGLNKLALRDVSAMIRPETALIKSLTDPDGMWIIEQNFDFDLLTPQKLLEKYVGRKVGVIKTHPTTGEETEFEATVLAATQGVVLKMEDHIETGIPGRIVYRDIPENLRDRPTLVVQLGAKRAGTHDVELGYLTGGLTWKADYVAELNAKDDMLSVNGWVTLTNTSGTTYGDARLQLVAGDVHRAEPEYRRADVMYKSMGAVAEGAPSMAEESLFEYHLYTLDRPTTIAENQTKQVALLSAASVPCRKEFLLRGADYYYRSSYGDIGQKMKVGVFVEFVNDEDSGMGIPIPKGIVRVYKKDSTGGQQFIGEDNVDHTPKNEKVRLKLGDAFDVTADKKQTDFKKLGDRVYESAYEIVLKNAKSVPVMVRVLEPVPGEWEVRKESFPHTKEAAGTAQWMITVPPESKETLTYRVRIRF